MSEENKPKLTPPAEIIPDIADVPEDDNAEPSDLGVEHIATEEEAEGAK